MGDNKNITDNRDKNKIDLNDPSEVEYVHQKFPQMKHEEIVNAIKEYGPGRKEVMEYLQGKNDPA